MGDPVVSVVVPARNAELTLGRTLAGLAAQTIARPFEVIVVDNGSTDATGSIIDAAGATVRRIQGPGRGPGEARNAGVASARAPLLAFTDADCVPVEGWLEAGVRALERADLVQGRVLPDPAAALGPFDRTLWVNEDHGLHETANLFVTRLAFDRAGGFEDWLEPRSGGPFGEDAWFGWRARRAGARACFSDVALTHHAVVRRGPLAYVAERHRLEHFPALAGRVPELRRALFFGRVFLNRRTAALDLAAACLIVALARRSPAPLAGAVPYGLLAVREARRRGGRPGRVLLADLAADLVGMKALASGSVRARSPLL